MKQLIEETLREYQEKQAQFMQTITERINQIDENNTKDRRDMGQAIVALRNEIEQDITSFKKEIMDRLLRTESCQSLQRSSGPIILTQQSVIPKFCNIKEKHPYKFIEELDLYFRKNNTSEEEKLDMIQESLEGAAANWYSIYKMCWSTYDNFKSDFLNHFWSEAEQSQLRHQISSGVWNANMCSMADHFTQYISLAKTLREPGPENLLIEQIMRHFPRYVQSMWSLLPEKNFKSATEFLRQQDNINQQYPHKKQEAEPRKKTYSFERPAPYNKNNHPNIIHSVQPSPRKNKTNGKQPKEYKGSRVLPKPGNEKLSN